MKYHKSEIYGNIFSTFWVLPPAAEIFRYRSGRTGHSLPNRASDRLHCWNSRFYSQSSAQCFIIRERNWPGPIDRLCDRIQVLFEFSPKKVPKKIIVFFLKFGHVALNDPVPGDEQQYWLASNAVCAADWCDH